MTAAFMINLEQEVCLAQFANHETIKLIKLMEGPLCIVEKEDGDEGMFTSEIDIKIVAALKNQSQILVAYIDENAQPLQEYYVDVDFIGEVQ
jgi:hypothetical protein